MKTKAILVASLAAASSIGSVSFVSNTNAASSFPEKITSFGTFTYDGDGNGVNESEGDIEIASSDIQANRKAIRTLNKEIYGSEDGTTGASTESLTARLAKEIEDRKAGDQTLTDALNQEIAARTKAVSDEAAARDAADKALADALNKEAADRASAITSEQTARTKGDADTLASAKSYTNSKIATESQARTKGDTDTLASAKSYTDSKISSESKTRSAKDTEHDGWITKLKNWINNHTKNSTQKKLLQGYSKDGVLYIETVNDGVD